MKVNVLERLMLQTLLPKEGNFTNLKLIRITREDLSFDEAELKFLQIREVGDGTDRRMIWNDGLPEKDVTFGETVTTIIKTELKKLNDATPPKLKDEHISLYEKFVENTGEHVIH